MKRFPSAHNARHVAPIIISSLDDCLSALRTPHSSPVWLQTAPGMLNYAGSLYLKKMEEEIFKTLPDAVFYLVIDAGDYAGLAQSALRDGHRYLTFSGDAETKQKLVRIAAQYNAVVF